MSENGRARCNGTTKAGEPCKSPERLVGEDGYCAMHRPGNEDRAKLIGQLGAEATKRRWLGKGIDPDELPPLRTPEDAKRWAEEIALRRRREPDHDSGGQLSLRMTPLGELHLRPAQEREVARADHEEEGGSLDKRIPPNKGVKRGRILSSIHLGNAEETIAYYRGLADLPERDDGTRYMMACGHKPQDAGGGGAVPRTV